MGSKFVRGKVGRSSFDGPRRTFGYSDEPTEMHEAICNKCGDKCEVPFRPNGKRPVFCRNCFVRDDESGATGGYEKRGFDNGRSFAKPVPNASDVRLNAIQKELGVVHEKLDALISAFEASVRSAPKD